MNPTAGTALAAGGVALGALAVHTLPAVASRRLAWRHGRGAVFGAGARNGVALTFDDGPDPRSTPAFLEALAATRCKATFFLLADMVRQAPSLVAELVAEGHEVGLHGQRHRNMLTLGPRGTLDELARSREVVESAAGHPVRWFRPPYGVLTGTAAITARRLGLQPVLWTAWGQDWTAEATPRSVHDTVLRDLRAGGTILLHDSDCTAAPGAWRSALGAIPRLADSCRARGWELRALGAHGLPAAR